MSRNTKVTSREKPWFVAVHDDFFELGLDPYAQAAYLWLKRRYGNGGNGPVYESVKKMADSTSMSPRRFHTALDRLESLRLIEGNRAVGQTTEYVITDKSEWVLPAQTSARGAEVNEPTSAPRADPPLHHVQKTSAPRADTSRYKEVDTRKEERETEPAAIAPESLPSSGALSVDLQIEVALRNPESPEARAFLASQGISTDQQPAWAMKAHIRRLMGEALASHPQIAANLPGWAAQHSLAGVRLAWLQAVARRQRDPNGLKPVLHFVDILNGVYKPDDYDRQRAAESGLAAREKQVMAAPKRGDRVLLPNGVTDTVHDYDAAGNWVILQGQRDPVRPADCQVLA